MGGGGDGGREGLLGGTVRGGGRGLVGGGGNRGGGEGWLEKNNVKGSGDKKIYWQKNELLFTYYISELNVIHKRMAIIFFPT